MTLMVRNFVYETANAPGTATTVSLAGSVTGRVPWSVFASGSLVYYFMTDGSQEEWGYGTYTSGSPNTLSRSTVLGNSAGTTSKLNFAGSTRVYSNIPAEKLAHADSNGFLFVSGSLNISVGGSLTVNGGATVFGGFTLSSGTLTAWGQVVCNGTGTALQVNNGIVHLSGNTTTGPATVQRLDGAGLGPYSGTTSYNLICDTGIFSPQYYAGSDRRLKDNIEPITPERGIEFVNSVDPFTFTMNGQPRSGTIAQQRITAGFGQTVSTVPWPNMPADAESPENAVLVVTPGDDCAYLLAALRGALAKIAALEQRVSALAQVQP
ncbi:MAG: tail fiber domain-containing protein [Rhodospirillales bacterium]|nr:tail fiber domain-containing protein [Rhodospirillales bacterium]